MGLYARVRLLLRIRTHAALDAAEDPRQVLDYAYGQQQELLRKVRSGLVDVATARHQLEQEVEKLRLRMPLVEEQARRAVAAGRDDLARIALERKQTALAEAATLQGQLAEVGEEERTLGRAQQQLAARIEEFRTRRATMSARYAAAEARVRVSEALTGVSGELADLSMAVGRAEEKTAGLQARARALDALIDLGALSPPLGGDALEQELRRLEASQAVEAELAALRGGGPPVRLEEPAS
jgi:phage shock protein A